MTITTNAFVLWWVVWLGNKKFCIRNNPCCGQHLQNRPSKELSEQKLVNQILLLIWACCSASQSCPVSPQLYIPASFLALAIVLFWWSKKVHFCYMVSFLNYSLCKGARDTARKVTGTCNWGSLFNSGPNFNVVYIKPETLQLVKFTERSVLTGILHSGHGPPLPLCLLPSCTAEPVLNKLASWWTTTALMSALNMLEMLREMSV